MLIKNSIPNIFFLLFLFVQSCAPEKSEESIRREESNRQFHRVKKAEGTYFGFLVADKNKGVPLSLNLTATRNPSDGEDKPALNGSMQIGLWGGVSIPAEETSFDWGLGQLTVTFKRESATPLELRGTILEDGRLENGTLVGPNQGSHPVILTRDGTDYFANQELFLFNTTIHENLKGQLSMKKISMSEKTGNDLDMPMWPPLSGSLRLMHFGQVSELANYIHYDPISGQVEIKFSEQTKIHLENVFLPIDQEGLALDSNQENIFSGILSVGNSQSVRTSLSELTDTGNLYELEKETIQLPPDYFEGTYQGSFSPIKFKAIASLEYLNSQGKNTSEYPFSSFPNLRFKMRICDHDGRNFGERNFDMLALDHLRGMARFKDLNSTDTLELNFKFNWESIEGKISSNASQRVTISRPQLQLSKKEILSVQEFNCH